MYVATMQISLVAAYCAIAASWAPIENGCVADLTASRVHPESVRRMRVWGAEGYAGIREEVAASA